MIEYTRGEIREICRKYGAKELVKADRYCPAATWPNCDEIDRTESIEHITAFVADFENTIKKNPELIDNSFKVEKIYGREVARKLRKLTLREFNKRIEGFKEEMINYPTAAGSTYIERMKKSGKITFYIINKRPAHFDLGGSFEKVEGRYIDIVTYRALASNDLLDYLMYLDDTQYIIECKDEKMMEIRKNIDRLNEAKNIFGDYYVEDDTGYKLYCTEDLEEAMEFILNPPADDLDEVNNASSEELDPYKGLLDQISVDFDTKEYRPDLFVVERQTPTGPIISKYEIKGGLVK